MPAWDPVSETARCPRSRIAIAHNAHEMRSPVDRSMSISRGSGTGETSAAIATSSSVVEPRALSTATTRLPASFCATIRAAARLRRPASATEVPPNFMTMVPDTVAKATDRCRQLAFTGLRTSHRAESATACRCDRSWRVTVPRREADPTFVQISGRCFRPPAERDSGTRRDPMAAERRRRWMFAAATAATVMVAVVGTIAAIRPPDHRAPVAWVPSLLTVRSAAHHASTAPSLPPGVRESPDGSLGVRGVSEKRLREFETAVLGPQHAAEHAKMRRLVREQIGRRGRRRAGIRPCGRRRPE